MKSSSFIGFNDPTPSMWWYTAWTRTKARFVRTYLGNIWIGLSNLLAVCVLGFVYRYVFSVDNFKYDFGYLAIGITLWSFISGTILSYVAILCTYIHNIGHQKLDRHFQYKLFSDQIL